MTITCELDSPWPVEWFVGVRGREEFGLSAQMKKFLVVPNHTECIQLTVSLSSRRLAWTRDKGQLVFRNGRRTVANPFMYSGPVRLFVRFDMAAEFDARVRIVSIASMKC